MKTFEFVFAMLTLNLILTLVLKVNAYLQSYITNIDDVIKTFEILKLVVRRMELYK